jgi:uncharacterized protein YbjT (DUF2867 family)
MKVLITGATGDVGARVVRQLLERGECPRIYARDVAKAKSQFRDGVEVFAGDLADATALRAALEGVAAIFLVNVGPSIPARDAIAAQAAKAACVKHLVKLSSMDVEQGLAIGAWHEKGETAIRTSGVPFTFVRPSGFMSNLLAWATPIKAEGAVRASTGNGRRPFIHSEDIASVSTKVLTTGGYQGEALALTGPEALTFGEVTAKIAATIGKPLRFEVISDDEARQRYARISGSDEETEAHVALWRAIREGRLATVTPTVEHVLGRKPKRLDEWLSENADAFHELRNGTSAPPA